MTTNCDLCMCWFNDTDIIFFNVDDCDNDCDNRAICPDCYEKISEARMTRDEQLKADAERAEQKRLEAIAKRREQCRKEKDEEVWLGLKTATTLRAQQEQDEEVLYFVCFVIFVISTIAFWFSAS